MRPLRGTLARINKFPLLTPLVPKIQRVLAGDAPWPDRFATARALVSQARRQLPPAPATGEMLIARDAYLTSACHSLLATPMLDPVVSGVADAAGTAFHLSAGLRPTTDRTVQTPNP